MTIIKALPNEAGCYVDGHWGQYAVAHMVMRATEYGYNDSKVIALAKSNLTEMMYPSNGELLTDDEHETLMDMAYGVEIWLNDNVAPEGYSFGWHDGEFYLWNNEEWESA